jgi:hemerythrin-like metal-binding protein
MAFIDWTEKLSVGVARYDEQHKKLIEIINRMHEAMRKGQGKAILDQVLGELVEYTQKHFADEEKSFDTYAYPDKEAHVKEHRDLIDQVVALKKKMDAGDLFVPVELMEMLRSWLSKHILETDKKYGPLLGDKKL